MNGEEEILEEAFALVYGTEGAITLGDVGKMTISDRHWFLRRLWKQKEDERERLDEVRRRSKR